MRRRRLSRTEIILVALLLISLAVLSSPKILRVWTRHEPLWSLPQ